MFIFLSILELFLCYLFELLTVYRNKMPPFLNVREKGALITKKYRSYLQERISCWN
jgi:hypothetical protein